MAVLELLPNFLTAHQTSLSLDLTVEAGSPMRLLFHNPWRKQPMRSSSLRKLGRLSLFGCLAPVCRTVDAPSTSSAFTSSPSYFTFLFCMKQTMRQTQEGHAQAPASLGDTGGTQVSDSIVCVCFPAHSQAPAPAPTPTPPK